ncbi:MAG: hypothetical protein Tp139DCM904402_2 [Prokaryotic dsDNA virus sp.]|jgi:hypothetical protein|nr:MAG: hypothetical protein Tp139DCM904402_2 [Prokaryotic dsDNA virus sp.]|tara:strand:- start:1707 stop:3338 length:1632 start_codon:yes stop_codon:yes gene_type:complete
MTISTADNTPRVSYTVSQGATQTAFAVPFEFFADADLNFYVDGTKKTLATHYTTSANAQNNLAHSSGTTGYIHTTTNNSITGATGGSTVVITRDIAFARTTDFPTAGAFDVDTLNTELDRITAIASDLEDLASRSVRLLDYDSEVSMELPALASRKGTVLGFNASTGAAEAGPTIANVNSLSAITTNINTVAGISSNVTTVAGISSNVTTVAGIASNVSSVAGVASLITSDFVSDLNTLATSDIISDLNTLATSDVVSDLNTLATSDIVSDLNKLATDDIVSDLNTLATTDIVNDLNTLATSDIVADLNLLATSAIVEDLNLLATSSVIADMATLAGSGANPNITSLTASGEIAAASLDISGNVDVDGTLEADAITVNGTALNTVIAGVTVTNATNSSHVLVTDNESTDEDNLITFVENATSTTGNVGLEMDGNLTYNPSTGKLTATQLAGTLQTAAQTNITSVGTLSGLTVTGKPVINAGISVKNGSTSAGFIEFFEDSDNGTNKATLIGPASTGDVTLTLPASTGTIATSDEVIALSIALA